MTVDGFYIASNYWEDCKGVAVSTHLGALGILDLVTYTRLPPGQNIITSVLYLLMKGA
jgi:hypothetical protein